MPIAGFVRLRKHQLARQAVFGTALAATRAYPFQGVPDVNLNWTDPEGDFGSLFPVAAPYRGMPDIGSSPSIPQLDYNSLPALFAAIFGGAVVPTPGGGGSQEWYWAPSWDTTDLIDVFTYEFGDDVTTDWFQLRDGIMTNLNITSNEDRGPLAAATTWMFAHAASTGSTDFPVTGTVPTPSLSVDKNPVYVYAKDTALYIDSDPSDIGGTQIVDALHTFGVNITKEVDKKAFVNGDQSFDLQDYGVTGYNIEITCQFAKTADTVGLGSEADAWFSETSVDRYLRFVSTSKVDAESGVPYSMTLDIPARYYTRADTEIGGNTTVTLTAAAFVDAAVIDGAFQATVVNTLEEATLGSVES